MILLPTIATAAEVVELRGASGRAVLVEHVAEAPNVRVEVAFPAGYARAEWPTLGAVYWHALDDCVNGAFALETTVDADAVRISGLAATADLPKLLDALRAAIVGPVVCRGAEIGRSLHGLRTRQRRTADGRIRALAAERLFAAGDPRRDPFGSGLSKYADVVELESFRDRVVALPNAVVAVAGACDAACALRAAEALLPDPPHGAPPPVAPLPAPEPAPGEALADTLDDLPQLHVAMARLSPGAASADWPAFLVVDLALSRRLHARLREREGRVYGVHSSFVASSWPDLWLLTTMVRPEGADAVVAGMREVVEDLRAEGVTADELAHLRAILGGALAPDDAASRARLAGDVLLAGGAHFAGRRALEAAIAVPLDAVNRFAAGFLAADAFVEVRLAPAAQAER